MPNQPRADNPVRYIRVEDQLWQRAQARADRETVERRTRVTVSAVVRDALEAYCPDNDAARGWESDCRGTTRAPRAAPDPTIHRAERDGVKVSAVVRAALAEYVREVES